MPKYLPQTKVKKTLEKQIDSLKKMFKSLGSIDFQLKKDQENILSVRKKYIKSMSILRNLLSKVNKSIEMESVEALLKI